jgi:hypothetical protein
VYLHQKKNWTNFQWDNDRLLPLLGRVRHLQGRLLGQMESLGFTLREEAVLTTLTLDVLKSSEIEGELLNKEQVRSSIARRLGLEVSGLVDSSRNVDGVVEMMLDATLATRKNLHLAKLFVGDADNADISRRRQRCFNTADMHLGILSRGAMAQIYRKLKHGKAVSHKILAKLSRMLAVFLDLGRQVKKHKYPHNSIFRKTFHCYISGQTILRLSPLKHLYRKAVVCEVCRYKLALRSRVYQVPCSKFR